jgi:hypothetical protein
MITYGPGLVGYWLPGLSTGPGIYWEPFPESPASVWGTKLVFPNAAPLVRIRRSSDNAEQDFYPTGTGWLDTNAVSAFIGVGTGSYVRLYDQSGNGRTASQATAGNQPTYALVNGHPVIAFAAGQNFTMANSSTVTQNVPGVTECVALQATTITGAFRAIVDYRNNATAARASMYVNNSNFNVGGRRLDANSYVRQEVAANTNWNRLIGRWRYSEALLDTILNGTTTTLNPFQTAGNTSNTASGSGPFIGAAFIGNMSLIAVYSRALSSAEVESMNIILQGAIP